MSNPSIEPLSRSALHRHAPVRPKFFRGQLLRDEDLRAIIDWTQQRFSLHGSLHGVGIVRGLYVQDAAQQADVACFVSSGAAIDRYGRPIFVQHDQRLRLLEIAPELEYAADGDYELDIGIRYGERPGDPQPVHARHDHEDPPCEFSRIREGFTFGPIPPASANPLFKQWKADYLRFMESVLDRFSAPKQFPDLLLARRAYLESCYCFDFGPEWVQLGRVEVERQNATLSIKRIIQQAPFRRILSTNYLPTSECIQVNLAGYVGQDSEKVKRLLHEELQLLVKDEMMDATTMDVHDLNKGLFAVNQLIADFTSPLQLYGYKHSNWTEVVAFQQQEP